jgi:hypothetical protein
MAGNSLYPAFFRLFYTVSNLAHVMTVPTSTWNLPSGGHPQGTFTNWNDAEIDADDMIQAYAALLQPFWLDNTNLDQYIIYRQAGPSDPPQPVAGNLIDLPGTNAGSGWFQAVQQTNIWRDFQFKILKIVMLEVPTANNFGKTTSLPGSGALFNLNAFITDQDQAIATRNGAPPLNYLSTTETLNEKLRAERRLT